MNILLSFVSIQKIIEIAREIFETIINVNFTFNWLPCHMQKRKPDVKYIDATHLYYYERTYKSLHIQKKELIKSVKNMFC